MGFTNIQHVTNQQQTGGIPFVNMQSDHAGESWACQPGFQNNIGRNLPIPQMPDYNNGLWIYTRKGLCQIIDQNWQVTGKWDGGNPVIFLDGGDHGVGSNISVTIQSDGDIAMEKASS
jgi:hypothetical protein